jgi:hypothetical protein
MRGNFTGWFETAVAPRHEACVAQTGAMLARAKQNSDETDCRNLCDPHREAPPGKGDS